MNDGTASSLDVATSVMIAHGATVQTDGWRGPAGLTYEGDERRAWILRSPAHVQVDLDGYYCFRLNRRQQRLEIFRRLLDRCLLSTAPAMYSMLKASRAV